jgi:hypothetical protein
MRLRPGRVLGADVERATKAIALVVGAIPVDFLITCEMQAPVLGTRPAV